MNNLVQVNGGQRSIPFADIGTGQMFRFQSAAAEENIYMKIGGSRAFMLKNGVDYHIANQSRVVPLLKGTVVQIVAGEG